MVPEATPSEREHTLQPFLQEIRPLVSLAIPLVLGLATSTAMGLVDTFMLGGLGENVLAAVSLTSSILLIFYAGLYGLVGPIGVAVGQAYGADAPQDVAAILRHGVLVALFAGVASFAILLFALNFLDDIGQPPEVIAIIAPYWVTMSLSLIPFVLAMVYKQFYEAIDQPWRAFWFTVVAVVANIAVNWLLIDGNLGFPALGILGAGIGSLVGQFVALVVMGAFYTFAPDLTPYRKRSHWTPGIFWQQVREGTPVSVQYLLETGAVAGAGIFIGWLGATELAANQIVASVTGILYMLPLGMASAVSVRVSQAVGAQEQGRFRAITYTALALVTAWTLAFTALLIIAGGDIAAAFIEDTDVIAIAAATFVTVGLMQVFDGLQSVSLGALRGIFDNDWPTVVSLVGYWVVALPASYFFGLTLEGGAAGVWFGFGLGLLVASALLLWRVRSQFARIVPLLG